MPRAIRSRHVTLPAKAQSLPVEYILIDVSSEVRRDDTELGDASFLPNLLRLRHSELSAPLHLSYGNLANFCP